MPGRDSGARSLVQHFFDSRTGCVLLPVFPVLCGMILKIALIDKVTLPPVEHVVENYLRGIWLELISISYIGAIAWGYGRSTQGDNDLGRKIAVLSTVPAILFVFCLCFALAAPKLGFAGALFTITIPGVLGISSLAATSLLIREYSQ